ncbi:MAG: type II toxin-antitoxin system Phd/YefM family antitoxin [Bradymonadales bacterium]|nr:type II toxin-antitoxin system Phd/YefM family antitoxin [Bradymonadales bacterium]
MIVNTITEAKAQLSALIERVQQGEEVIIHKAGKPVAVLIAYGGYSEKRVPGALRGQIEIAPDFDELPPDIAESFGMIER